MLASFKILLPLTHILDILRITVAKEKEDDAWYDMDIRLDLPCHRQTVTHRPKLFDALQFCSRFD